MWERIKNEPVILTDVVTAVVALAVAFGVPVSADQKAAIIGVVVAVVALAGGAVARKQVTPDRKTDVAEVPTAQELGEIPSEDEEDELEDDESMFADEDE